jgi:hypothetical protein
MGSRSRAGVFNAVAPPGWATWEQLLELCRGVVNPGAALCWVDGARVAAALQDPWSELPLWPAQGPETAAIYGIAATRARDAGLRVRQLAATVGGTWAWLRDGAEETGWRGELRVTGLDAERERELLLELRG